MRIVRETMPQFRPWTAGPGIGPTIVRQFFAILAREEIPVRVVADRSGMSEVGIGYWRNKKVPSVTNFQAALNSIGYDLKIVRLRGTGDDT